jgi:hypothetical protein
MMPALPQDRFTVLRVDPASHNRCCSWRLFVFEKAAAWDADASDLEYRLRLSICTG